MKDFRVIHVDLSTGGQEIYISAHNHRAPGGVDPVSVYRFDPDTGNIRKVNLTRAQALYMARWNMSYREFESSVNLADTSGFERA
jgi:hypothetical protein